jgi:predicted AlkP superfamily phosphohydrolase/phosphomutase
MRVWLVFFCLALSTNLAAAPKRPAKVVLIGIDGVSLNLLEPFAGEGVAPNLGRLMKEGTRGHLASIWPLRTPQVWTSAVTGKLPGQHGIWDHLSNTYFNPPEVRTKEKHRVTSEDRRSKALWSLLDEAGLRTLTVGWMASWPAEKLEHGVLVAPVELMGDPRQTTIKGSFFRDASRLVTPERLWPRVRTLIVEPKDIEAAELAAFADIPPEGHPLYALPRLERYVYTFEWSLARARSVEAITLGLLDEAKPEVVLSYFQCPDSLLHRFWIFSEPVEEIVERLETHGIPSDRAAELKKRFGGVVEACYRDVDARVGRLLDATRGADTVVMVVSDHGFGRPAKPHKLAGEPYAGDHLDEGVILAAGPGIKKDAWIDGASILDVTPTLLAILGRPVAEDMRGRVLGALFDVTPPAAERIPTYETKPQLDAPHASGWPERKVPLRPTAAQMPR